MGGSLLASICMYEMFLSYSGQSGGSLSNAHKSHVISCMKTDGRII